MICRPLDRLVRCAGKVFDPQVLLDPLEEQFHLRHAKLAYVRDPAALVKLGNDMTNLMSSAYRCNVVRNCGMAVR
jgi:hypothetical protein